MVCEFNKNIDPKLGRYFGSTEQIIAWLGKQFWNQTFDDDVEVNIEEIRDLLDDDGGSDEEVSL